MAGNDHDAIIVEGLEKAYGSVRALQGVSFAARTGTVLGLLGPNGAGKTTAAWARAEARVWAREDATTDRPTTSRSAARTRTRTPRVCQAVPRTG